MGMKQGDMIEFGFCVAQCCVGLCQTLSLICWLFLRETETKFYLPKSKQTWGCYVKN